MAYLVIKDFQYGMDRRRPREVGVPGTLWVLKNAHLTRGGDIERAKKFVPTYTLPEGTHGLAQVRGQLYVFGSSSLANAVPLGVLYQQLQAPGAAAMTRVIDVAGFNGKLYVIAEFADGSIHHFYDGTRVSHWQTLSETNASREVLTEFLANLINQDPDVKATAAGSKITITAAVPGVAFTIARSTTQGGGDTSQSISLTQVRANVPAVAEVRAQATIEIVGGSARQGVHRLESVTADGVQLMVNPVDWLVSNDATANAVAVEINNQTAIHGYTATTDGSIVTLHAAPGSGADANGAEVVATASGDFLIATTNFSGGVTAVEPVAQVYTAELTGSFHAADVYHITINGRMYSASGSASGMGSFAFTYKQRMFSVAVSNMHYSRLLDPTDWMDDSDTPEMDGGFINMANESEGSERLEGLVQYNDNVAIFAPQSIRIYRLSQSVSEFQFIQSLDNTGTASPQSLLAYGNNDVFYLDATGIRSLRARDSSNAAFVSDIGTAIDPYIQELRNEIGESKVARAVAIVEPTDGRYWLALGPYIVALSYFPGSKVTAWSVLEPGFEVSDFVRVGNRVYARAGNTIYLYGGESGSEYPDDGESPVIAETAFLDADSPATHKRLTGFDIACSNVWDIDILVDPNDETKNVHVGHIGRTTFTRHRVPLVGETALFALRMVCDKAGPARISRVAVHYEGTEAG